MSGDPLPVGPPLPGWRSRPLPPRTPMVGRWCRVEPLVPERHAAELFAANAAETCGRMWTYMPYGPFADEAAYRAWMADYCLGDDPLFHAVVEADSGRAMGLAAFMRIDARNGVIEVGNITYAPALRRTRAATEAMALMMARVFDGLGYRRYEWKCDALNAASRAAAERLGFRFEGVFRQAIVYKGRNRDTAWYSVIDSEWPALRAAFEHWLAPQNFDAEGRQRRSLAAFR